MSGKIVVHTLRYPGSEDYYFRHVYYNDVSIGGAINHTEDSPYPIPYAGSRVPLGFSCWGCGGGVVTDWQFYYGPTLRPQEGRWVGKCLKCGRIYSVEEMNDPNHPHFTPPPKPRRESRKDRIESFVPYLGKNKGR